MRFDKDVLEKGIQGVLKITQKNEIEFQALNGSKPAKSVLSITIALVSFKSYNCAFKGNIYVFHSSFHNVSGNTNADILQCERATFSRE